MVPPPSPARIGSFVFTSVFSGQDQCKRASIPLCLHTKKKKITAKSHTVLIQTVSSVTNGICTFT